MACYKNFKKHDLFVPNRIELAWAAGFFDGEGSAGYWSRVRDRGTCKSWDYFINASASQVNREELERFRNAVGVGRIYGPYMRKQPAQPIYKYMVQGFQDYQHVMSVLWPFLCSRKRKQLRSFHSKFIANQGS